MKELFTNELNKQKCLYCSAIMTSTESGWTQTHIVMHYCDFCDEKVKIIIDNVNNFIIDVEFTCQEYNIYLIIMDGKDFFFFPAKNKQLSLSQQFSLFPAIPYKKWLDKPSNVLS